MQKNKYLGLVLLIIISFVSADLCYGNKMIVKGMESPEDLEKIVGDKCLELDSIIIKDNLFKDNFYVLRKWCNQGKLQYIYLKNSEIENQEIPYKCFSHCETLKEIILPDNITHIAREAFRNCYSLTKIDLPANLISLDIETFCQCYNLSDVKLPGELKKIGFGAFQECNFKELYIPDSVEEIDIYAFANNFNLKRIFLGKNINKIGLEAFSGLQSLEEIRIGCNITSKFDKTILCNADKLKKIYFCEGVEKIESNILNYDETHNTIEEIFLPTTIKSLGTGSMHNIKFLKRIICYAEIPPLCINENINTLDTYNLDDSAFGGSTPKSTIIYVPKNTIESYKHQLSFGHYFSDIRDINELSGIKETMNDIVNIKLLGNMLLIKSEEPISFAIHDIHGRLMERGYIVNNYLTKIFKSGIYLFTTGKFTKKIKVE